MGVSMVRVQNTATEATLSFNKCDKGTELGYTGTCNKFVGGVHLNGTQTEL